MSIVTATNLKKYYGTGDSAVKALNGVDLSVEKGSFTTIVGSDRKSTRLNSSH